MWTLQTGPLELVFRAFVIFIFLFVFFRFFGKKQLGQMSAFDLILLLIVSEAISTGFTGGDNSLLAALIVSGTLLIIAWVVDYLAFKSRRIEKIVEGSSEIIIQDGHIVQAIKKKLMITDNELLESLREHGVATPEEVKIARVESSGKITIIKK